MLSRHPLTVCFAPPDRLGQSGGGCKFEALTAETLGPVRKFGRGKSSGAGSSFAWKTQLFGASSSRIKAFRGVTLER
jgi:hypothetical protein